MQYQSTARSDWNIPRLAQLACCTAIVSLTVVAAKAQPRSDPLPPDTSGSANLVTGSGTHLQDQVAGGVGGARMRLVPVPARVGMYPPNTLIVDQEITLDAQPTTTRVWIELKLSGWDPNGNDIIDGTGMCTSMTCTAGRGGAPCTTHSDCDQPSLAVYSTKIVGSGFADADLDLNGDPSDDGDQVDIYPATEQCSGPNSTGNAECVVDFGEPGAKCVTAPFAGPCPFPFCCQPMLSNKTNLRPDALWLNVVDSQAMVDTSSPLYNYQSTAAATSPEIYHDDGTVKYAATLVVDVPPAALGRYTIPLNSSESFMGDRQSPPVDIPLVELSGASIRIRGCSSNADCNDNDACTQNQCNVALSRCDYPLVPAFDPLTECCDAASGNIAAQSDSNPATCDSCSLPDSRGVPAHLLCSDGDACTTDQCNASTGLCQFPLVPAFDPLDDCCDPVSGMIASRVDADDCTDDVCTLPNSRGVPAHPPLPDTTPCDDFRVCTLDDHCDGLNSQANGGCIGDEVGDIACVTSLDCENLTGTPYPCDAGFCLCEELPGIIIWDADPLSSVRSTRRLTFTVTSPATAAGSQFSAIAIRPIDLESPNPANPPCCPQQDFSAYEAPTCTAVGESNGCVRWLGPVVTVFESQDNPALGSFKASRLQCTPFYFEWTAVGPITATGPEIMPSSIYEISSYSVACQGSEATCIEVSAPAQARTRRSGDVAAPWNPPSTSTQPDPQDIVAVLDKFINRLGAPSKAVAQIQPNVTELNINITALDTVATIDAFRGRAYPFTGPCPCPSSVLCNFTPCTSSSSCSGGLCIMTCNGGAHADQPCRVNADCPDGSCPPSGFCRDRCGRCSP